MTNYSDWEQTGDHPGAWVFAKHYSTNVNPEWVAWIQKGEISSCVNLEAYSNGTGPGDGADAFVETLHICEFDDFVDAMIELRDLRKKMLPPDHV